MPRTTRLRSETSNRRRNSIPVGGTAVVIGRIINRHIAILKTNLPTIARAEARNRVVKHSHVYVVPILAVNAWAATSAFAVDVGMVRRTNSFSSGSAQIALGGILSALCWLFLILAGVMPTGRFFLLTMASLVIVVACLELGQRGAFIVYLATSALAFVYPNIFTGVMFALCFGFLPQLIVFLRVRTSTFIMRVVTHIVMSAMALVALFVIGIDRFAFGRFEPSNLVIVILVMVSLQLFLLIYHYVLRVFERFYMDRISPWLRRRS